MKKSRGAKNAVIFTQNKLGLKECMDMDRQASLITYWGYHTPFERYATGFKFGFVITKLK